MNVNKYIYNHWLSFPLNLPRLLSQNYVCTYVYYIQYLDN